MMQYSPILKGAKQRVFVAIAAAFIFKFLLDVIFGLIYRNYNVFQPFIGYLYAIIPAYATVEGIHLLDKKLSRRIQWETQPQKRFFTQFAAHVALIFLMVAVFRWGLSVLFIRDNFIIIRNEVIILAVLVVVILLFNLFDLGLFLMYKWRHSLAELERFKKENAEYRFEMLQNQINPHFLFNSLNTLSSIMYQNVDTAASYIRQLSQVYRYVLENRSKELVPLKNELSFIEAYKYLFELRFTDRLTIAIDVNSDELSKLIAPMTLQLLVENSVKHNIISQKQPLTIRIYSEDGFIVVKNNLQKKPAEGYSSGMGLKNIGNRYEFFSSKEVQIIENSDEFIVKVPLIEANEVTIKNQKDGSVNH